MKRGISLFIIAALLIANLLTGCGAAKTGESAGESTGAKPAETSTATAAEATLAKAFDWKANDGKSIKALLVTHTWTDATIKRLQSFTDKTGIAVTYDTLPEEEYYNKLSLTLSGGSSEYDVFMTGAQQIWEYAPGNWIEPLDDYISNPGLTSPDYDVDDFLPSDRAAGKWDLTNGNAVGTGKTWALPWVTHGSALFYRKDILEKHNIQPPKNLEELYDAVVKLKQAEPDKYPLAVRGARSWSTIHTSILSWFTSYGGKDFDASLKSTVNSPESVKAHELWGKIIREGGSKNYASSTWAEVFTDIVGGKAIMGYDADVLGYFIDQPSNKDVFGKIAWTAPPGNPAGKNASPLWLWLFSINANSKNKEAAWYFVQWVTGKEHLTDAAVNDLLANPVRKSIWDNEEFKKKLEIHTNYYETFRATQENSGLFYTPQSNFFRFTEEWAAAVQKIVAGQASAQEALDEVAAEMDKIEK